jgi:Uma2 family endonuclease
MSSMTEITLDPEKEYEVVDGEPQEKEMGGARHSGIGARLLARIVNHVEAHGLGGVYGADATFQIGQNERLPDVSFVAAERIPLSGEPEGIWPFAPDLAVEVVSPNDLYEKVLAKVREYLAAGVRQVWLISPEHRTVTIHETPTRTRTLGEEDELSSEELLPGFRCAVRELFRAPVRKEARSEG